MKGITPLFGVLVGSHKPSGGACERCPYAVRLPVCVRLPTEFGEVKKRVRTTAGGSTGSVRNLRIREDTAKYLLNLDMNSAYYDPKTRWAGIRGGGFWAAWCS